MSMKMQHVIIWSNANPLHWYIYRPRKANINISHSVTDNEILDLTDIDHILLTMMHAFISYNAL